MAFQRASPARKVEAQDWAGGSQLKSDRWKQCNVPSDSPASLEPESGSDSHMRTCFRREIEGGAKRGTSAAEGGGV